VSDPYRGDDEASALRLKQLDAEIVEREARLSDAFWERVAPVWGVPRTASEGADPRQARHNRLAELDRAIARARSGPSSEAALPPPDAPGDGVLGTIDRAASIKPLKAAAVLRVDVIKGDASTAHAFLTEDARAALLAVEVDAPPTVIVADDIAEVRTVSVTQAGLERLTELLTLWHRVPSPVPLPVE